MSLIRRRAAALFLLMVGPTSLSVPGFPPSEVQIAFAILSEPSVPLPWAGDVEIADGRFKHGGDCRELGRRYQAADAPLPSGAVVTVDNYGNLQVDAPYGSAAVLVAESAPGTCEYQVAVNPTMVVETAGAGRVATFSSVLCFALLGYPAVGSEFRAAGESRFVHAIMTDPDRNGWQVAIGPGGLEEALASQEEPGPDVTLGSFTATMEEGRLIGDGSSDDGPLHIELRCTPFRPLFAASG